MPIIDRIKWDGNAKVLAWKFPSEELATWSHLIVNETQDAFLVRNGVYEGPFAAGNHELKTENLPILREIIGLAYGGKSPFSAEVWFVNKTADLSVKWGTSDPIQLIDPQFKVPVSVRAFGQFGLRVVNSKLLLSSLVGTVGGYSVQHFAEYFRAKINVHIKSAIAEAVVDTKGSIFDLSLQLNDLSQSVEEQLKPHCVPYGLELVHFVVESVNTPPGDVGVEKLKQALARRAEMNIVGYTFEQQRQFDVMEAVAASPAGGAAAVLGTALGVGAMAPLATVFGQASTVMTQSNAANSADKRSQPSIDPSSYSTKVTLLKQLAELRDSGILTEEEFQSEKRKILDDDRE